MNTLHWLYYTLARAIVIINTNHEPRLLIQVYCSSTAPVAIYDLTCKYDISCYSSIITSLSHFHFFFFILHTYFGQKKEKTEIRVNNNQTIKFQVSAIVFKSFFEKLKWKTSRKRSDWNKNEKIVGKKMSFLKYIETKFHFGRKYIAGMPFTLIKQINFEKIIFYCKL